MQAIKKLETLKAQIKAVQELDEWAKEIVAWEETPYYHRIKESELFDSDKERPDELIPTELETLYYRAKQTFIGSTVVGASIYLGDAKREVVAKVGSLNLELLAVNNNVADLIALECVQPSPFGDLKTGTTVIDEKVRSALEIPAKHVQLTVEAEVNIANALEQISKWLFNGRPVKVEMSKLNIYNEGGFFEKHIDTPRDDVLGTLLLHIPTNYEGGELEIWDQQESCKIKPKFDNYTKYQFTAFYGSLPHQVHPVSKGSRVTISFYIKEAPGQQKIEGEKKSVYCETPLYSENRQAVMNESLVKSTWDNLISVMKNSESDTFGLFLDQKYSAFEVENNVLKGFDQMVMNNFSDFADVEIIPVFIKLQRRMDQYDGGDHDQDFGRVTVYKFDEDAMEHYISGNHESDTDSDSSVKNRKKSRRNQDCGKVILLNKSTGTLMLKSEDEGAESAGNESRDSFIDNRYYHTMMIIKKRKE